MGPGGDLPLPRRHRAMGEAVHSIKPVLEAKQGPAVQGLSLRARSKDRLSQLALARTGTSLRLGSRTGVVGASKPTREGFKGKECATAGE